MIGHIKMVWSHSKSKLASRLVLLCIADHADKRGRCFPSVGTISRETALGERTVQEGIKELQSLAEIEVLKNKGPNGVNVYQFTLVTPAESAPPQNPHPRKVCTLPPQNTAITPAESAPKEPLSTKEEPSETGLKFAQWFRKFLPEKLSLKTGWKNKWALEYDALIRIDERTKEEVQKVCEWAKADNFWSQQINTPCKLRKRNPDGILYFDVILQKMNAPKKADSAIPSTVTHKFRIV